MVCLSGKGHGKKEERPNVRGNINTCLRLTNVWQICEHLMTLIVSSLLCVDILAHQSDMSKGFPTIFVVVIK